MVFFMPVSFVAANTKQIQVWLFLWAIPTDFCYCCHGNQSQIL